MRKLITGIDADGGSCVVEEAEVVGAPVEGIAGLSVARLFRTDHSPPPARPSALADTVDVQLAPGLVRWMVVDHEPYATHHTSPTTSTLHNTDTLDLVFVKDGRVELVLQDGGHDMGAGDCAVMAGVDHAWKAGPDGCRLIVVSVGTPPPGP
jgi:hypothetical protein